MNCKQGDLAIVVKSFAGNEGAIVRVVSYYATHRLGPAWVIDRALPSNRRGFDTKVALDTQLRPIRGDEGDDETLAWAGKPEGVTA